jgi:hypothetical protein
MLDGQAQPRTRPSRRTLNAMLLAAASTQLLLQYRLNAQGVPTSAPRPFRVDIPQATIDRILNRVRDAEWPDRLDANDWRYGTNWDYMRALTKYWVEQFDWRKAEANLNRYPQFRARVGCAGWRLGIADHVTACPYISRVSLGYPFQYHQ